jgi:hypothetical protein
MVNTNYHKSINKTLISRNYFDSLQKRLLLGNEHPGFAIGILKSFGKNMINTWNGLPVISKVIHNTAAVVRNNTQKGGATSSQKCLV